VVENLGPDVPWHFTAFHPDYRMLDKPPTPIATLRRARAIAREHGMRFVYTGNVHDPEGQTTSCPACGGVLIGRDGYEIRAWNLDDEGGCLRCGARCPGVFDGPPGRWGARRMPVRLAAERAAAQR
jgi:pyruvate formate lyase activating enzyme